MVADEVITGFFRTGERFACETYGIEPDIIINVKQLSSAYLPISSVMLNEKVYKCDPGYAGRNGYVRVTIRTPVSAAVALETLKI